MSFTIDVLREFYPDDHEDTEEEVKVLLTLGPFKDAYVSGQAVYGDFQRVAYADGVNPGMWVEGAASEHTEHGFGLVDATGFHIREGEERNATTRTRAVLSIITHEKCVYEFDGRLTDDDIREALATGEHHAVESDIRSEDLDVLAIELIDGVTESCDCPNGWLWPMASDGDDAFPFVERCDDCKVFADDIAAAKALAATLEGGRVVMEPVHGDPARLQPAVYPHERWSTPLNRPTV